MWSLVASVAIAVVALLHLAFFVLESFLWTTPTGRRIFGMTSQLADSTKVLAANQGLYNGFLAAGLLWGLGTGKVDVQIFFLACVLVAGIYGSATASRKILFIQAIPAAIGLALVVLA